LNQANAHTKPFFGLPHFIRNEPMSQRPRRTPAVLSLIGETPLIALRFEPEDVTVWAKCEFLNPSGSVKDRFAAHVIADAEKRGELRPDSIIVECTSGNTGIALAMVGAAKGYRVRILMSENASHERRYLMRQLGAELVLFKAGGYQTGIELTREMAARDPLVFLPRQFENPLNAQDHERGTAQEILREVSGPIHAFVAGYGTGGTLAGVGRGLKARWPELRVFAMEPAEAAMLCGEMPCCHWIEGVAGGFIPPLLRTAPVDGEVAVKSADALAMTQRLNREFGLLVGTSSGANVAAAREVARELGAGATVVTLLCDRAERYFSTRLFATEASPAAASSSPESEPAA
jgi:cysteine synthase A